MQLFELALDFADLGLHHADLRFRGQFAPPPGVCPSLDLRQREPERLPDLDLLDDIEVFLAVPSIAIRLPSRGGFVGLLQPCPWRIQADVVRFAKYLFCHEAEGR